MANGNLFIQTNINQIASVISSKIAPTLNNVLKQDVLEYYAKMTEEQKRHELQKYKNKFQNYLSKLESDTSVNTYFEAYESILEFRQFILGALGTINYTFAIKASERGRQGSVFMKTITLGKADFLKLIKDGNNVVGLSKSGNNLRFNSIFLSNLRKLIKSIESHDMSININSECSSFILVNETLGTKSTFTSGKLFRSRIDALQRQKQVQKFYDFTLKVTKDISRKTGAEVFKYFITKVEGNPESSSIFSAIGKYFSDEMTAKRSAVQESFEVSVDPSYPNAGNLTQLYILAKNRLNDGINNFREGRRAVSGKNLFELYNEVKSNTEPFYSGGDILLNQIKSFLGSNPSLTSYATIRKTIQNFYNALNKPSLSETKNALSKLLLQQNSMSKITQEEKELSLAISQSFETFFKDLIN